MRILLGLILLLLSGAVQSHESPTSIDKPKTQATQNNALSVSNQRAIAPSPLVAIPQLPQIIAEQTNEQYEHFEKPRNERWIAYSTIGLFFVTTLLAIFTYLLWGATRKLVIEAKEIAKKQLRAYVSVEEINMQEVSSPEIGLVNNVRITVVLKNGGNTPTKNLLSNIHWDTFDTALSDEFDFPDSALKPAVGFVGPGSIIHTRHVDIPVALMDHVARRLKYVYIWGWADYNDVIDSVSRHRTEFCFEILKDGEFMSYRPHGDFNGADEGCYRQASPYKSS